MSRHEPKSCQTVLPLLDRFAGGILPGGEESAVRDHLAACSSCRALAAGRDPSVLFLELRGQQLPDSFWAGFSDRLRARLEPTRFPWRDLFRYPRLAYLTAPAAMALILAVTLFVADPGRIRVPGRAGQQGIGTIPGSVDPGPSGRATPGGDSGRIADALAFGDPVALLAPPVLEEVGSPGARVYRFDMGEGSDATSIFLVIDESIDI